MGGLSAQWVKRWPPDPAVSRSIPTRGVIFTTVNGVPLHTAFHYHPRSSRYDLNNGENGVKSQVIHPSIVYG